MRRRVASAVATIRAREAASAARALVFAIVLAVALIYWRRRTLAPRDYLFLGAVSGLVFGASEVVHYFTVNGVAEFYLTIQSAIPPIEQLLATGHFA
jgi:hypothetical protein